MGFAFLAYEDQRSTILAVDNMNGAILLGRTLRCDHTENYRRPKKEKKIIKNDQGEDLEVADSDEEYDERRRRIWDYKKCQTQNRVTEFLNVARDGGNFTENLKERLNKGEKIASTLADDLALHPLSTRPVVSEEGSKDSKRVSNIMDMLEKRRAQYANRRKHEQMIIDAKARGERPPDMPDLPMPLPPEEPEPEPEIPSKKKKKKEKKN